MHTAAAESAQRKSTPDSIFAIFRRDLAPKSETEELILRAAALAQYSLERVSEAMLAELDAHGYTDLYFKLQRSEAKDRAELHACLTQYRQLESRRIRYIERLKKTVDKALDRAVTPKTGDTAAQAAATTRTAAPFGNFARTADPPSTPHSPHPLR